MKLLCITVYVHSLHISHHFFYRDTFDSTQFAIDTTHFHNSTSILHSVLSFTPSLSLFIKLYNLIKVSIYDVHSYGSFTLNTAGNFAVWQMSIFEDASRLKYGHHAVHLSTNLGAPIYRPPPNVDNKYVHSWQLWIRTRHRPNDTWTSTSHRTYWNTMPTYHQWTNLLQARPYYTTEVGLTYFTTKGTILHCSTELKSNQSSYTGRTLVRFFRNSQWWTPKFKILKIIKKI